MGRREQTLPVIIETGAFTSELTVTNFSPVAKTLNFRFVADAVEADDDTASFSLTLQACEQRILPQIVDWLRQQEVVGIGPANQAYVGALFATVGEGDMSGIVIGARTGAPDQRGGQYGLFYNGVPYGAASVESAWIYGLQQNGENRSNLALVNTGEVNDSSSTFEITIYDGSGDTEPRTRSVTLGPRRWTQENGILGSIRQGLRSGEAGFRRQPVYRLRGDQRRRRAGSTQWRRGLSAGPAVRVSGKCLPVCWLSH